MRSIFLWTAAILLIAQSADARPTRPGELQCQTPLRTYAPERVWTDQEVWVWDDRVCLGQNADLSQRPDGLGGGCDLSEADEWPVDRVLTPEFMQTVLFYEPFRSAYARRGFRVSCATFNEELILSHGDFPHELWLRRSYFPSGINFIDLAVGESLFLTGSRVDDHFDGDRLIVSGSLFLRGRSARFQSVDLIDAHIDGSVDATEASFVGHLNADRIHVEGNVELGRGASFRSADFIDADVEGSIDLREGSFRGELDFTGVNVSEALILADSFSSVKWEDGARLVLRNSYARAIQDNQIAWDGLNEGDLDLIGFTYDRIGGIETDGFESFDMRSIDWRIGWIESQDLSDNWHSPQPYQQLADTLRAEGFFDKADDVMVAGMDDYRDASTTPMARKILLWIESIAIGYGYENWRALIGLVILLTIGAFLARNDPGLNKEKSIRRSFWYSADRLIPLIELDGKHKEISPIKFGSYFNVHHVVGFLLVSLLVAGLTGLTK